MNRWDTSWLLLKDVALTGTGLWIIYRQATAMRPSDLLLTVSLVLIAPSVATHAKAVLSGHTAGESSTPGPPEQESASLPSSGAGGTGDGE